MLSILARGVTADDYLHMPESLARRHLIDGNLLEEPTPVPDHQEIVQTLYRLLWSALERPGHGKVWLSPLDVWLDPETCVQPDVFVISRSQPRARLERWVHGPPDLVVEVQSPSTRRFVRGKKRTLYAAHGVREMWIIDPVRREVEVFDFGRMVDAPIETPNDHQHIRSTVFPALSIPVSRIFG